VNRKVAIVGVLDQRGSTNISQAKSFMRFGFETFPINYRTIINKYGYSFFEDMVLDILSKEKPHLTLWSKCNNVNSELIKKCSDYTINWLWNMDPINTIKQCPEVLGHARVADFSSCTGLGVAKWFEKQGVKKCYHILDGLDYDIFRPFPAVKEFKAGISFIGSRTPERDEYGKFLKENGYDVKFYGLGYGTSVLNDVFSLVCSSSHFMLSLNTYNDIEGYFSNRLLRYLGCGSCVFHLDPTESLGRFFRDREDLVFFKNKEDLLQKLKSLSMVEASRIALRGRDTVLRNYTWDHTIKNILDIVKEKNG